MSNEKKTASELLEKEEKLVVRIRDFLRKNSGFPHRAEDITNETGIKCVDTLLSHTYGNYLSKFDIKRINTIDDSCLIVYQYYYKSLRKMRWREYLGILKR